MTTENFIWTDELVKEFAIKFKHDANNERLKTNEQPISIDLEIQRFKSASFNDKKYSLKEIQDAYSQEAALGSPLFNNFLQNLTKNK